MFRVQRVRGIAVWAFLLCSTSAFAASYTSTQSGNWNDPSTWGGGVPISGDTVTITSNHVVTVTDARVALSVTLDSTAGNKMLVIDSTGNLLLEATGGTAIAINTPSPGSTNIVRINGGTLEASGLGTNLHINGGSSNASKLELTSLGGTVTLADNIVFAGTAANAIIDFGPSSGTLELGGDLGNGGTILNNAISVIDINGSGAQTINSYTFNHLELNKTGGTATLNGPITVNGDLTVASGVLDDGGNQISLNGGGTSNVTVGSTGVLKLGSAASATFFPTPLGTAAMNPGSAVVYQSGLQQAINSAVNYDRLYLATYGAAAVTHITTGSSLTVNNQLDITDNGPSTVTLGLGTGSLDLNGDLTGDGTVSMTSGSMTIAGNFSSSASLNAGAGTVTYDGSGSQSVLGATYHNLAVNKSAGPASLSGNATVNGNLDILSFGTLTAGTSTLTVLGDVLCNSVLDVSSGTLRLNGSLAQTVTVPFAPLTIKHLEMNNGAGASMSSGATTITNSFVLNGGIITGNLTVDVLASVTRTSGWVAGNLTMGMNPTPARRFHVGTNVVYIPVDADAGSAGTLTVRANEGKSPDRTAANVLNRYWSITGGTVTPIDSITFNYNQADFVDGDETKYILASYDSGSLTFTHYGDVDDVNNNVTATSLTGYIQDWMIGQPGSLAAASKLAIISVNGGTNPSAGTPFDVIVESRDDGNAPTPVFDPTDVSLSVSIGSGSVGGTITGTIPGGSDNVTITGVTYSPAETNVQLGVTRTAGDVLANGTSSMFDVLSAPTTITVTNLLDSGVGSLREAITTANSGSCSAPCTIEFSVPGEITLATALPAITADDLTINGFTAPGSSANTNPFGLPSNAILTLAVNGSGSVSIGFAVQATNVKIAGFAIKNFGNSGVAFSGTNTNSRVEGCYIGTDISGTVAAPSPTGVHFNASIGATAGGVAPAARNVISGNTTYGILADATSTVSIVGNYVGTDRGLTSALPNNTGVKVCDGCTATIGQAGTGNVVSGNTASGIVLSGDSATLVANLIGVAGSGGTAMPNANGIQIDATAGLNTIGGASPSHINVISGNSQNGILVRGDDNIIDNNWIGLAPDGTTPRGNGGSGVRIENTASRNFVGTSLGNKIVYNVNDGVTVTGGLGNVIHGGKIAGNTNRGIDLDDNGTTNNDATDADTGANNLQNFPVIAEAKRNAGMVDVKVSLDSSGGVNANFVRFDVYKADPSTPAQGVEFLGDSGCLTGNVFTNQLVSVPLGTAVVGNNIVATATVYSDAACSTPSEGTSEFSAAARIGGDVHWIAGTGNWETAANWNPATVPTSSDTAYIDNVGTYTVTINAITNIAAVHVGSVSGAQTLVIGGGQSLNLTTGTSTVATTGILTLNGIGIGASGGALTVNGVFNWNVGSITGAGGVNLIGGSTMNIATASGKALNAGSLTVSSGATVNWTAGPINMAAGATIANSGLFDITTDNTISDAGSDGGITNNGTFQKSAGTGFTTLTNVDLINSGTIKVMTGTLNPGNITNTGGIELTGTLLADDSIAILNAGSDVSGTGLLQINGGAVTANAADTIPNLRIDGGTLNGAANISVTSLLWDSGTMSGAGTTTIPSGATATFTSLGAKGLQRTFSIQNGGTANINSSGTINMSAGGNFVNDGTIDVTAAVTFNDAGSGGDIANTRTFRSNHGGHTTLTGITLNNSGASGQIDIQNGALDVADGTNSASILLGSGGTFLVNSDSYTLAAGTTVGGTGNLSLAGGVLNVTGPVSVPQFSQNGGTVDGSGTLTLSNSATWQTGTMQGGGTTTVGSGATLNLTTPSAKALNNRTLSNLSGGTVNLSGVGIVNLSNGGNVANAGLLLITVDSTFNDGGTGGNIVNTGTIRKQSATGPTSLTGIGLMHNNGLIDIQTGTISITGDTYTQAAAATLKVWLNGTTPGTGFGQLSSNVSVALAGTLEVALTGPYQPLGGDTFRVVAAPAHAGDFAQPYTYPVLANSRTFSDAYDASGLLLTVNGDGDLSLVKTAPSNVIAGAPISYTITVTNAGPDIASSVSVTDVLETGHTFLGASGTGWSCNAVALTVTCTAATLNTGAAPAITINANAPVTPQTFTNVANVTSSNDSNGANNSDSAIVTVDPLEANLELSSLSPVAPIGQLTPFTFTFQVKNKGPQTASGVVFTAPIPSTLTFNSAVPDAGTCNFSLGTVTCNVGSILNNVTLDIDVNLTSTTTPGTHIVTGSVSAAETDPTPGNNSIPTPVEVTGSTITVTNTNDSGMGSLREALDDAANGTCTPLPCTIAFNIPGPGPHVIQPTVELPLVEDQTLIDATTQPGYTSTPLVQIDGQSSLTYAFEIDGDANAVKGLSITGFTWGIDIHGDDNVLEANSIGLDLLGAAAPNDDGLRISGNTNTIDGNVISGNTSAGVYVESTATGNTISGNRIGTDPLGTTARPNTTGIAIVDEADGNTIGGATPADGNIISGNTDFGISIEGDGGSFIAGTPSVNAPGDGIIDNTVIRNNWIGPNASGTAALGAGITGIALADHANNTDILENVLSGNQNALAFSGPGVTGTTVSSNKIGIAPDGTTPMGNTQNGIVIANGSNNHILGNAIANNGADGVSVLGGTRNRVQGNGFSANTDLAIDLNGDGATPNDATDSDAGPNGLQNWPLVANAYLLGGGNIHVAYSIDSSGSPFPIGSIGFDIYKADPSGEGQTILLGNNCFAGNAFGAGTTFNAPAVGPGDLIVLTATSYSDPACAIVADGTSEFSNTVVAANCTPPPVTITGPTQMCAGGNVTLDAGAGFDTYLWSTGATTRTISVSPGSSTTYTVTVTDAIGCPNSDSHGVTVNPLPTVTITGPTSMCASGSVILDAGAGFPQYLWSNGATTQTITVSPASTQNYSVTVTDANGCQATDSHTVTVTANPTVTITGPTSRCTTGPAVTLDAGPGFASYSWSNGATSQTITVSPATTATYTVTVGLGACTAVDSHTVTVSAPPTVTITGPTSACDGTSVTLDAGPGFGSYLWSNGATSQTTVVAVNSTQTHSVTVSNGPGCSATDSHTVTATPAPSAIIDAPSPVSPNKSGLAASVAVQPGATYVWSITNGTITSGNGTHAILFTAGASGLTHLHATVTLGGCTSSFTRAVFIEGTTPTGQADLAVTKTATASVQAGAAITYTIGIRNFGPGAASNVTIIDTLPAGTTFVTLNDGPWNCTRNGATITCTGNAPVGTNSTITVVVNAPQQSGIVTNTVQITSATTDPNGGNNSASASTSVQAPAPTCPAGPPSLLLPIDAASVVSPVTFSWTPVTGATEYELWIGNALAAVTGSTSTSLALPSGTVPWFVVARSANGCDPLASAPRTVTILESGNCATNSAPVIRTPASGTAGSPTTFMWTPVAQAIGYRLWIEANGTAAQDAGTTNGATSLNVALPTGAIVAYVDALFSGCPPARSAPVQLTVPRPEPCISRTTATPLSPANDAVLNSSSVDFTWTEAAGADGYRIWYSLDGAAPAVLGTTTSDTSLKAAIGRGTVDWYVETLHDGCASTESQTRRFTIPASNNCPQQKPELISPTNNSSVNSASVQFAWTSVPNTVSYELWASVANGTPVLLGKTQGTSLTRTVPAGKIDWFVRAVVDRCGPRDSQKSRFILGPPDACAGNDRPLPVSPLGRATVSAPVRFDWSNVNAARYELFVIRGDAAPQLVATTTATEVSGVDLTPGKVRWFVRAHFGDTCEARDSAERRLEIVPAPGACAALTAPLISAPGQISAGVPFLLQWTPVNGATAYQVLIADNAGFTGAGISTVNAPELLFEGVNATTQPLLRYIRVRAIDTRCQPAGISPYGPAHVLFILPKGGSVGSALFGGGNIVMESPSGRSYAGQCFTATPKQPWISVSPANGIVPAGRHEPHRHRRHQHAPRRHQPRLRQRLVRERRRRRRPRTTDPSASPSASAWSRP